MFWPLRRRPKLDWLQIEISSKCNASCSYCPRHALSDLWTSRLISDGAFARLLDDLAGVGHVHLQGWGEPLTHPRLVQMVRDVKARGPEVGTTTNGVLMTPDLALGLVDAGLDVIAFSVAGVGRHNDDHRRGTTLDGVRRGVDAIHDAKRRLGRETPRVHVAHMLLRSCLDDVERLPGFLADLGAVEAVVSSLSVIVDPALEAESLLGLESSAVSELSERLRAAQAEALERGCRLQMHLVLPGNVVNGCAENVTGASVVGSGGEVSPCVLSQVPVDPPPALLGFEGPFEPSGLRFGSLSSTSFSEIWRDEAYRRFRRAWKSGAPPESCRGCPKRAIQDLEPEEGLEILEAWPI